MAPRGHPPPFFSPTSIRTVAVEGASTPRTSGSWVHQARVGKGQRETKKTRPIYDPRTPSGGQRGHGRKREAPGRPLWPRAAISLCGQLPFPICTETRTCHCRKCRPAQAYKRWEVVHTPGTCARTHARTQALSARRSLGHAHTRAHRMISTLDTGACSLGAGASTALTHARRRSVHAGAQGTHSHAHAL